MIILGGLLIICISQLIVINWTIDFQPNLISSCITTILVYGIGFPLSNTAILGSFSTLQKIGRQGFNQGIVL